MNYSPCLALDTAAADAPPAQAGSDSSALSARRAALGWIVTLGVALISALALSQPGSVEAQASAAVATAAVGV